MIKNVIFSVTRLCIRKAKMSLFTAVDQVPSSEKYVMQTVSAATATVNAHTLFVAVAYTATGAVTVTMPAIASCPPGRRYIIKDTGSNANTNNITIATPSSETIDGAATLAITADDGVATLLNDGSNWFTV